MTSLEFDIARIVDAAKRSPRAGNLAFARVVKNRDLVYWEQSALKEKVRNALKGKAQC